MKLNTTRICLQQATKLSDYVSHFTFQLPPEQRFDFLPGQFITIHFEDRGKTLRRSYSIANRETPTNTIEFAAGYVKQGIASERLFKLQPGDSIDIVGPFGRLVLKEPPTKRTIFVGTSTGVTPYRAMLNTLSHRLNDAPDESIVFLQGVRYQRELLYGEEFRSICREHINAEFIACYSREQAVTLADERLGYVQAQLMQLNLNNEKDTVYLCGNPDMIDDAYARLKSLGFDNKHIIREKYISSK